MANQEHLEVFKQGIGVWNEWRENNPEIQIDLSYADLSGFYLMDSAKASGLFPINFSGVDLQGANLSEVKGLNCRFEGANLSGVNLSGAMLEKGDFINANLTNANLSNGVFVHSNFSKANLTNANLTDAFLRQVDFVDAVASNANFSYADIEGANLWRANFENAVLSGARLIDANLANSNFSNAILRETFLSYSDLTETDFTGADLSGADLTVTSCVQTIFENANINDSRIYGASVWNIKTNGLLQNNLVFSRRIEAELIVDDIEVAQFIYLMLNNNKIRNVLGTISKKGVLILGRFTPERKAILDAIRNKLRELGFLPMMFDFEKVATKDFTETIKIMAGMSRFVIADISNPSSSPLELQATLPDYKIPFIPIIEEGQRPFAMFRDLTIYPWCLEVTSYKSEEILIKHFQKMIDEALEVEAKLNEGRNDGKQPLRSIEDL